MVQYGYDEYGQKTVMTYPDGTQARYAYDEMSRLVSATEPDGTTTRYEYDRLGRRTQTTDGTLTTAYRYDKNGNLTEQKNNEITLTYQYDKSNRMTEETRTENGKTLRSSYAYDAAGQLISFRRSDGYAESYAYDPAGNMVEKVKNNTKITMTYDAANELKTMESVYGKLSYAYDANGNVTQKTYNDRTDTYSYDARNHLKQYKGYDGYTVKYNYNALGMLHQKESKGSSTRTTLEERIAGKEESDDPDGDESHTTRYTYDLTQPYYEVLTESTDGKVTSYTYGLERLAAYTESTKTAYLYDGRGSVAQTIQTNSSNSFADAIRSSKAYSAFGELLTEKTSGYGYNGEYYDAATGLLNLRARQYAPAVGRFEQRDILKGNVTLPLQLNRYAFVLNNPINYTDPSGKFVMTALIIGAAVGFVVGAAIGAVKNYNKQKAEQTQDPTKKINGWEVAGHAAVYGVIGAVVGGAAGAAGAGLTAAVGTAALTTAGVGVTTSVAQSAAIGGLVSIGAGATNRYLTTVADNIMDKPSAPKNPVKEALDPTAMSIDAAVGISAGTVSNLVNQGFTLTKSTGAVGKTGTLPEAAFEETSAPAQRSYVSAQANSVTPRQREVVGIAAKKKMLLTMLSLKDG